MEKRELSNTAGGHVNGTTTLENCLAVFAKDEYMHTQKTTSYNSNNACIYSPKTCVGMFIVALFIITQTKNNLNLHDI